ncbi:MAG: YraN family protein [Spirochaetes bacterium]|nr:YraN family protein [Spirochaetota bacterium]
MNNVEKGMRGEEIVQNYLIEGGYRILERNFRFHHREVDIIAAKDDILVFVEVKSRKDGDFGRGFEAISDMKKRNIISVARYYTQKKGLQDCNVRFDVASLDRGALQYFENAFQA